MNKVEIINKKDQTEGQVLHSLEGSIWQDKAGSTFMFVQIEANVFNFISLTSGNRKTGPIKSLSEIQHGMTKIADKAKITIEVLG